ncbi:phosphotransferase family protein [Streptomyces cavernae]|uniref:phosphotransferase family protein n=1 Tax=Streptomyces cavernae TaxID=2259034 RepID=UPI001391F1E0|nr:aminoglycoside phosphotransferase family protein [Streptomyces cavernae]
MKLAAQLHPLLGLLPLRLPRALGGLDDHLRARWLVRGTGPCDIAVVRRPTQLLSSLLVFELRRDTGSVVVKHSRNERGATTVCREWEILRRLADDDRLEPWRPLLPRAIGPYPDSTSGTLVQNRLPGVDAELLLQRNRQDPHRIAAPALRMLAELRDAVGHRRPVAGRVTPWIEPHLAILSTELRRYGAGREATALEALRHRLDAALAGAVLTEGWTHGDYHPGNVLLDGEPLRVTGVFDWGNAHPDGPCEIDAYNFVLALRATLTGRSPGHQVADILRAGHLSEADRALLALAAVNPDEGVVDPVALPLLTWLWLVADNLRKSWRFMYSRWWVADTVTPVLRESLRWAGARS